MYDLAIHGATLVTGRGRRRAHVYVQNGSIAAITDEPAAAERSIDAIAYSARSDATSAERNATRVAAIDDSNPAARTAASSRTPPSEMGHRAPRAMAAGPTAIAAAIAPSVSPQTSRSAFSARMTVKRCDGR